MISRLLGLIWLFFCVFAQDDDASPTVIQINSGSTTELMTFTEPTGTATSTPTSSSANTNTTPSASSTHITRIVILVVTAVVCIPCGLLLRRYRRHGYFFRPPKKSKRKAIDTHPGIAELPQGGYHETTELMAEDSPGEMGLGGHHETVEMEGSLLQPKEMAATGSTSMKWGTTSSEIQGFERKRGSMEISPC
ncbi:hypothetical protein BCON_0231g00100 [Botryotinia convoluta]|uniref:Mid2 domain-containing protein n=1 Tax=Botryotinia convoluta TaxID=54673 RepID=A0A4Z1HI59_9HELO|nr:hypothetical protein BCON_0231g00100 [Botryotinia convoluta]